MLINQWILLILILSFKYLSAVNRCPKVCTVCFNSHLICEKGGLDYIPNQLYDTTAVIMLSGHTFLNNRLTQSNFTTFSKPTYFIRQLSIRKSNIELIEPNTFYDLTALDQLDLSQNYKLTIREYAFSNLKLKNLILDNINQLILKPGSFKDLEVSSLSIQSSGLLALDYDLIKPLSSKLVNLYLRQNQLKTLSSDFSKLFLNLVRLDLSSNPIYCSCKLGWLSKILKKRYNDKKLDIIPDLQGGKQFLYPKCANPIHLKGQEIINVSESFFICTPPSLDLVDIYFEGPNLVRLSCLANTPNNNLPLEVYWKVDTLPLLSNKLISNINSNKNKAVITVRRNEKITDYKCFAKSTSGNATIKVKINWPPLNTNINNENVKINENKKSNLPNNYNNQMTENFFFREQFTLLEMLGAVLGTFIITLLIFLIIYQCCIKNSRFHDKTYLSKQPMLSSNNNNNLNMNNCINSVKPNMGIYETSVYSDSQTYDIPQNTTNTYATHNKQQGIDLTPSHHFFDYRTQQKIIT